MTYSADGSSSAPILTQPLPVDWETLCKYSAPVERTPAAGTAAPATATPAGETDRGASPSLKVPVFRENETPLQEPVLTRKPEPAPRAPAAPVPPEPQVLWPEPEPEIEPRPVHSQTYYRPYPGQGADPYPGAVPPQAFGAYLQPQIERAIVARLEPLIENASRSAADAAADRIRAELLGKIDLIVREAVELEMSRLMRR